MPNWRCRSHASRGNLPSFLGPDRGISAILQRGGGPATGHHLREALLRARWCLGAPGCYVYELVRGVELFDNKAFEISNMEAPAESF